MLTSIILLLLGAIFFGSQFVPKKFHPRIVGEVYNVLMVSISLLASLIAFLVLSLLYGFGYFNVPYILWAVSAGILWCFGNWLNIKGIDSIGIAKTAVLLNLAGVYSFVIGAVFLHETVKIGHLIGIPLMIAGAVLITLLYDENSNNQKNHGNKEGKKKYWTGVISVCIASFFSAVYGLFAMYSIMPGQPSLTYYASIFFTIIGIFCVALLLLVVTRKVKDLKGLNKKETCAGFTTGLIWVVGIFFFTIGLPIYSLLGVAVLQALIPIVGGLWGILVFKEIRKKTQIFQYSLGVASCILGIMIFYL